MATIGCPRCGCCSAETTVIERYIKTVDFKGVSYGLSDNEIISGGGLYECSQCGLDVSDIIKWGVGL